MVQTPPTPSIRAPKVPFADHAMVVVAESSAGEGAARIPDAGELHNHIGSVHAGALFTVGETASGAAFVGAFGASLAGVRAVTRKAEISYRKIARGAITARASLSQPAELLLADLAANGRTDFDVVVDLTNADNETVAEMTVSWNLAKPKGV